MNKTVKHIVEGFDFGNISNDNPSKNITRNLRRSIDDYINENAYKFLHGDTSIDPEFFDMVACYKPKDRDELGDLVGMADVTYNGNCSLNWIDVSDFKYLNSLFYNSRFIGDISKWDVSNCEEMSSMFARSSFNGDISEWETGSCKNMSEMFQDSEFNSVSSAPVGSSQSNSVGVFARARAIDTRFCSPPESCAGKLSIRSPRPTRESTSLASIGSFDSKDAISTFSSAVRFGIKL